MAPARSQSQPFAGFGSVFSGSGLEPHGSSEREHAAKKNEARMMRLMAVFMAGRYQRWRRSRSTLRAFGLDSEITSMSP